MSKELLQRFTYLERIVHWVVGATFVALLLTGALVRKYAMAVQPSGPA